MPRQYNVDLTEEDKRFRAEVVGYDVVVFGDSEQEAVDKITTAIAKLEEEKVSRYKFCTKCRRYEPKGSDQHMVKKRGRKKKKEDSGLLFGVGDIEEEE